MDDNHSPKPWRMETISPAFAVITDANGRNILNDGKVFKDDAALIVEAVGEYRDLHCLALAVKQMRTAQRTYFRTRDKNALGVAINAEHDVDRWLEKLMPEP